MAKFGNSGNGNGGGSLANVGTALTPGVPEDGMTEYRAISSFLISAAATIGLALLLTSAAGAASIEPPPGAEPPGAAVAKMRADRDGDRLEDALAARIAASRAGERFDVIVMFDGPDAVGRGRAAAGPFAMTREFSIINGFQASLTGPQIRGLSRAHGLFSISANTEVQANDIPSNDDMGATDANFDFGLDGFGVTICVVDTGIDAAHELFDTKGPGMVPLGPAEFHDSISGLANPYDDNGHGSHVAGISTGDGTGGSLADDAVGVASGASVVSAKALDANGSGTDAQVLEGVQWCAARTDVDIVSMSLGGGPTDGNDPLSVAVNCVADPASSPACSGTNAPKIIVVSAGNSGALWSTVGAPGTAELAITVGSAAEWSGDPATGWQDDGLYLNSFSSRGPVVDGAGTPIRIKPDITGPGSQILSAYIDAANGAPNVYAVASGTSMSTPFVAGVIALMLQADPTLGVADAGGLPHVKVRNILAATAEDRGAPGMDNEYGHGVIDAYSAVAEASGAVGYVPNAYPGYTSLPGQVVADLGNWTEVFTVTPDLVGLPIAGTATINGTFVAGCAVWFPTSPPICLIPADVWSPDLEVILEEELPAGSGNWSQVLPGTGEAAFSECPARGECGQVGRVEVVHFIPQHTGTYRFRVFPANDTSNQGVGGNFDFEISMGAPVPAGNTAPTAGFSFATSGLTANFSDGSSDSDGTIVSRSWDFGDGSAPSTATNPSHAYPAAGTYSVTLTVTDDDGDSGSATQSVTIATGNLAPTAAFTFSTSDLTANFTDASTDTDGTVTGWTWDFGDGNTTTATNPSHAYAVAGTYSVTLTVTDDVGASTTSAPQSVSVTAPVPNVPPTAAFTFTTSDLTANFTDASTDSDGTIASRSWNFGDGNTSTVASPSHTYAAAGTFSVTLTVTDDDGASDTSAPQSVTVTAPAPNVPPTASFTVDRDPCGTDFFPNQCQFTDTSADSDGSTVSWNWNFGGGTVTGGFPIAPGHQMLVHFPADGPNPVTVSLTVTDDDGATHTESMVLPISHPLDPNAAPTAGFSFTTSDLTASFTDASSDSDGTIASRSWNFGDGNTSTATNPSHAYAAAGTYSVTLTVTDNDGATNGNTQSVTVTAPSEAEATFVSIAAEDGWVRESGENSGVGGRTNSRNTGSRALRAGDDKKDKQYRFIVSFDTSSIPAGATMLSARLELTRGGTSGTNPFTTHGVLNVDVNLGSFGGNAALQNGDFEAAASGAQVTSIIDQGGSNAVYTVDLGGALGQINAAGRTQLRMYFATDDNDDAGNDFAGFYSANNGTTSRHPRLIVTYQAAGS